MFDANYNTQLNQTGYNDYQIANHALELGNYQLAMKIMQARVKNNPVDYNALTTLARTYWLMDKVEEAHQTIKKALSLRPHSDYARSVNGLVLAKAGEIEKAEVELKFALKVDPTSSRNYYFYALFLLNYKKDLEAAKTYGIKAIELNQDVASYHALMARLFWQAGQLETAELAYYKALSLEPSSAPIQQEYELLRENRLSNAQLSDPLTIAQLERQARRSRIQSLFKDKTTGAR